MLTCPHEFDQRANFDARILIVGGETLAGAALAGEARRQRIGLLLFRL